jgi:hypothetical protein
VRPPDQAHRRASGGAARGRAARPEPCRTATISTVVMSQSRGTITVTVCVAIAGKLQRCDSRIRQFPRFLDAAVTPSRSRLQLKMPALHTAHTACTWLSEIHRPTQAQPHSSSPRNSADRRRAGTSQNMELLSQQQHLDLEAFSRCSRSVHALPNLCPSECRCAGADSSRALRHHPKASTHALKGNGGMCVRGLCLHPHLQSCGEEMRVSEISR